MNTGFLNELLTDNSRLRSKVYARAALIECELDRLRGLRAELALAAAQSRKRKRNVEQVLFPDRLESQKCRKTELSSAFLEALHVEVEAQAAKRRTTPLAFDREVWEETAMTLSSMGHRCTTPYELLTAFKRLHPTHADFTTAEAQMLCQLVQENGFDWRAVGRVLQQRFGRLHSSFDCASQYRYQLRRVFVQNRLTQPQLATLLNSSAIDAHRYDLEELVAEARRFTTHKLLQVNPRYLQKEVEELAFARYVPERFHLYWKIVNLTYQLLLCYPYRLDTFHHKMTLCHQQLSLSALSHRFECAEEELKARVVKHLLSVSRSPDTLSFEECSKTLFGSSSAASVIYQVAEELYGCGS